MLHAFADAVDARVAGAELIVDENRAVANDAVFRREFLVRANSGGDHDHVGGDFAAIGELHAGDSGMSEKLLRARRSECGDAEFLDRLLEDFPTRFIELHAHEPRSHLDDGHAHVVRHQAFCGFQAKQSAADDNRRLAIFRVLGDVPAIVDRAKYEHAVQRRSLNRGYERPATGRENQHVVFFGHIVRVNDFVLAIDLRHTLARVQRDLVFLVPRQRVQENLLRFLRAVEHVGKQDAVVVSVRLVAEHHDVEIVIRIGGENVLGHPRAGHAVADDDELAARDGRFVNRVQLYHRRTPDTLAGVAGCGWCMSSRKPTRCSRSA